MANKLPPEITGKYRKKHASRIQENEYKLNFGIYKDKGYKRNKVTVSNREILLPPPCQSVPSVADVEPERQIVTLGTDGFFPYEEEITYTQDHSIEGFVYDAHHKQNMNGRKKITVTSFTLFSGVEDQIMTFSPDLADRMLSAFYVPFTFDEQVKAYQSGNQPPIAALPIAQIARLPIAHHDCTLHPSWDCSVKSSSVAQSH